MGSVHGTSSPLPDTLYAHIGQGSLFSNNLMKRVSSCIIYVTINLNLAFFYLINSERMAIKWQLGQRVKSFFTTCIPWKDTFVRWLLNSCKSSKVYIVLRWRCIWEWVACNEGKAVMWTEWECHKMDMDWDHLLDRQILWEVVERFLQFSSYTWHLAGRDIRVWQDWLHTETQHFSIRPDRTRSPSKWESVQHLYRTKLMDINIVA